MIPGRAARASSSPWARTSRASAGRRRPTRSGSRHAPGRRIRHPRRVHPREGLSQGLAGLRGEEEGRPGRARAAPRSAARRAGRGARRQAPGPRAQLSRRRDPDADPSRRRDGLQDHHLPARARGLQGGQGDRRARRRRLDVLRLVGLQDRGGRRHSAQRRADDPQGRAGLDQLRRRRAAAAAEHGSGQGDSLRRRQRRAGPRHGDAQPGEATEDRQPRRLDRSRQGRRPGRLEPPSAVDRRDRRTHLRRRHRLLRPREGPAAHRRHPERKGRPLDDRGGPVGTNGAPARRRRLARPAPVPEKFDVKGNANGPTWAITNARIVTVSGPVIPKGTIVIKGNRIEAVGANVAIPVRRQAGRRRRRDRDAGNDRRQHRHRPQRAGVRNYDDVTEILPFDQMLRTRVAYRADSLAIPVARTEGITTVGVRPGGGTICGELPVMNLDGWTWEEATLRPSAGLAMNFPGAGGGRGGGGAAAWRSSASRGPRPDQDAQSADRRARVYAKQPAGRQVDWTLEPFLPVLDRRQALYVTANTEQNIRDAVAWAEKQNVRIVLQSGADVQRVAGLLKQHDVPVILTSILTLPPREDDFHAYPYQAPSVLEKAGVPFAFSSGGFQFSRDVPFQAGRAVAWGLSRDDAIKALTLDAARILGVDSQVGSIEAGKIANLVVISGDPLEVRSQIRHVVIAGRDISLDNSHVALFKKYMAR